ASLYFGSGFVAERGNNWLTGAYANYNIYETRDGRYVSVGCLEKKFWSNLCLALDRADFIDALDDESQHERIKDELTEIFRTKTMQEWAACLEGKDTCVTPVLNFDEALAAEQTRANAMVLTVEDEEIGTYKQLGFAMKMSATPGTLQKRAPKLGEDTEAVLRGCGLSEAELDLLTKE
ncbi:CoA transferase, partial [Phascolarctobacterium faecium]